MTEEHGVDGCRLYLERLRWPGGVNCPRCDSSDILWLERRRRHSCRECRYQFRVTAQTVFHDSHVPLEKWFVAVSLMLASEGGVSASSLRETLGGSYKTSWFLEHRIRSAMALRSSRPSAPVAYSPVAAFTARRLGEPAEPDDVAAPSGWPLLRSLIAGSHGHIAPRYLLAYWAEVIWREENRSNPNAFRETVAALLAHPWLPWRELTGQGLPTAAER